MRIKNPSPQIPQMSADLGENAKTFTTEGTKEHKGAQEKRDQTPDFSEAEALDFL